MKGKKYIVTFSGGKDSLDTIIWCINNLTNDQWEIVFCDTDWEDEITYQHIQEVSNKIGKEIIVLRHEPYPISDEDRNNIRIIFGKDNLFAEMVIYKSRFPSTKARFCTEELKAKPMIDYVLSLNYDITIIQGVRADESQARKNMKRDDDYFKFYFEPYKVNKKGKKLFHTYRKQDVIKRADLYSTDVFRPIIDKTAIDVFNSIYSNGFKPNGLYQMGMSRVGCFPCVMCQKVEIKKVGEIRPIRVMQIKSLESMSNSTFFPPAYIPLRLCTKKAKVRLYVDDLLNIQKPNIYNPRMYNSIMESDKIEKFEDEEGDIYVIKIMPVPTIEDVIKYVSDNPNQTTLFEPIGGCVSVYNICETNN